MTAPAVRGILIDPHTKTIKNVSLEKTDGNLLSAIYKTVDCRAFDKVEMFGTKHDVIVDDEGLFVENQAFFHLSTLCPYSVLAGNGLVLSFSGKGDYRSSNMAIQTIKKDIVWLSRGDAIRKSAEIQDKILKHREDL